MPRPTPRSELVPPVPSLNVTTVSEQARTLAAFIRAKTRHRGTVNASTIELGSGCAPRVASLVDVAADHEEAA